MSAHWSTKFIHVNAVIEERKTPLGQVRLTGQHYFLLPLLLPPSVKPLRGVAMKDWRLELLVKPTDIPTPLRRKHMREYFGTPLCSVRKETPNPNNPLPQSVDGWWWHAGCWVSAELIIRARLPVALGRELGVQLSVWLEAAAGGTILGRPG